MVTAREIPMHTILPLVGCSGPSRSQDHWLKEAPLFLAGRCSTYVRLAGAVPVHVTPRSQREGSLHGRPARGKHVPERAMPLSLSSLCPLLGMSTGVLCTAGSKETWSRGSQRRAAQTACTRFTPAGGDRTRTHREGRESRMQFRKDGGRRGQRPATTCPCLSPGSTTKALPRASRL